MNELLCSGKYTLTPNEIIDMPSDNFNILSHLSKNGMPICEYINDKGLTNLRIDERYIYERYDDPITGSIVFKWKPRNT